MNKNKKKNQKEIKEEGKYSKHAQQAFYSVWVWS